MSEPAAAPWPDLRDEDRSLIDDFAQHLRETTRSAESLQAQATELRQQADETDIRGIRTAASRWRVGTKKLLPLGCPPVRPQRPRARSISHRIWRASSRCRASSSLS
jgi:hypothetical protein